MKEIVLYPDEALKQISSDVCEFGSALTKLVDDMTYVMRHQPYGGVGITAIQCREPLRLALIEFGFRKKKMGKPLVICNPKIIVSSGQQFGDEGCLSLPGQYFKIIRPQTVNFQYFDQEGKKSYMTLDGLFARCLFHEIDHMDGKLINDGKEEKA